VKEQLLDRYLYTQIHEIIFCSFPVELYKLIVKLGDGQGRWRLDNPIVWTLDLVRRLEASEYKIMRIVEHWIDHIIGGSVTEFMVNTSISYSKVEHCFFKGRRGKYLKLLNTWIKMFLYEQWVMRLP